MKTQGTAKHGSKFQWMIQTVSVQWCHCLYRQTGLQIFHWASKYLTSPWIVYLPPLQASQWMAACHLDHNNHWVNRGHPLLYESLWNTQQLASTKLWATDSAQNQTRAKLFHSRTSNWAPVLRNENLRSTSKNVYMRCIMLFVCFSSLIALR